MRLPTSAVLLLLTACEAPPAIEVHFPRDKSHFSADTVDLRGTFVATNSDPFVIRTTIDGQRHSAKTDEADQTWVIEDLPLDAQSGEITLVIEVSNRTSLLEEQHTISIDRNELTLRVTGITHLDERLLISDTRLDALVEVDTQTGEREIVSAAGSGEGPVFSTPNNVQFDAVTGDLLVVDVDLAAVFRVNATSGDRAIISGADVGGGPALITPRVFGFVPGERRIVVADIGLDALLSVDLESGDRAVIYTELVEDNPVILSPRGIAVLADGNVLVVDDNYRAVIEINPDDDISRVVSNIEIGGGPRLGAVRDIKLIDDEIFVLDGSLQAVVRVDRLTGNRQTVSDTSTGAGTGFDTPVAFSADRSKIFVADDALGNIIEVDGDSGDRTLVSEVAIGTGVRLEAPFDIELIGNRMIVSDRGADALVSIPESGERTLLTRGDDGNEPRFVDPGYVTYAPEKDRVYMTFTQFDRNGVLAIDPAIGTRELIADPQTGDGPPLIVPADLAYDDLENRLIVLDSFHQRLVGIDLTSHTRTVISDSETGIGDPLRGSHAFAFNPVTQELFVLDSIRNQIVIVNAGSGDRSPLTLNDDTGLLPGRTLVDIQLDATRERLLLLDTLSGALLSASLTTGELDVISSTTRGLGPELDRPSNFVFDEFRKLALVVEPGLDALFAIDLETGNRSVISK